MKKSIRVLFALCLAAFISACEKEPVHVERIILDSDSITLHEGENHRLTATVSPVNAVNKIVRWKSSASDVASVEEGVVVAVAPGTAVITAISDDLGCTATCVVTVLTKTIKSISLDKEKLELHELEKATLTATVTPEGISPEFVIWGSSDETVATVTDGIVLALRRGEATITAKNAEGDVSASCTLTVICAVQDVNLSEHGVSLKIGETFQLDATVYPDRANDKSLEWSSSDASVATVSDKGLVEAIAPGKATIGVKTTDGGFTDTCDIVVMGGIKLQPEELKLVVGEESDIQASFSPEGVNSLVVNWSSTKPDVASVDDKGHVVALNAGEAIICATTAIGGFHAFCPVSVRNKVDKITVSPTKLELFVGFKGGKLESSYSPSDAGNIEIVWSSDKPEVATVDDKGNVSPVGSGVATIKASTTDGKVFGSCVVTVLQPATSISIAPKELIMYVGDNAKTLTVSMGPENADIKTFSVNNSSSKTVKFEHAAGENTISVTALEVGTAKLEVFPTKRPENDYTSATCSITVRAHVESVSIRGETSRTLNIGSILQLYATVLPENAYNKNITWKSSKESVAVVDAKGIVTAKAAGTTTITVTTEDGSKTATVTITVPQPVTGVTLDKSTLSLTEGDEATLKATVAPSGADQSVTWVSNKPEVATVDDNGKVTAVSAGSATITASSAVSSDKKATCAVTVTAKVVRVKTVTLTPSAMELLVGETREIAVTILPTNAANKALTWSSSDQSIVLVDSYGKVTAKSNGTATVTCTSQDNPEAKGTCQITVSLPPVAVTSITLSKTSLTLSYGSSSRLVATISPSDATDQSVEWSSDKTSVASVDQTGLITAGRTAGTATITVKSVKYPEVVATCSVTVVASIVAVTGISISPRNFSIYVGETKKITATVSPSNATDKTVTWQAAGGAYVTVDQQGNVKGLKPGNTTVTAFAGGGSYQTTARIEVKTNGIDHIEVKVSGFDNIEVSPQNGITLKVGETVELTATPIAEDTSADPSYPSLNWTVSSGSGIVTVDQTGRVTAMKVGTATIKVASINQPSKSTTIPVTVLADGSTGGGSEGVGFENWNF